MKTGFVFDILNENILVVEDDGIFFAFEIANPQDFNLGDEVSYDDFTIEREPICTVS